MLLTGELGGSSWSGEKKGDKGRKDALHSLSIMYLVFFFFYPSARMIFPPKIFISSCSVVSSL